MSIFNIAKDASLEVQNNYLIARDKYEAGNIKQVPIHDLEMVVAYPGIELKGDTLLHLVDRKISLLIQDRQSGRIEAHLGYSGEGAGTSTMIKQVMKAHDPAFACELARNIISGKVTNQIRYLKRRKERVHSESAAIQYEKVISSLEVNLRKTDTADGVASLRGYEGNLARIYFGALPMLINDSIHFPGRVNHKPKDIINTLLNIGYGYIGILIYNQLVINNLKPDIGFLHSDHGQYPTLMYDAIEEWRTPLVDQVVIGMINRQMVSDDDYYLSPDDSSLKINHELSKKLREQVFDKLASSVRIDSGKRDGDGNILYEQKTYNQLIGIQVKKLKEVIVSDETLRYKPYTGD